ncbi:NAD(P)H-binding protein [Glaciecola sp. 1036]|uniref:NmrA family NAD(P)-binding protein n=1 Tax=Alteromonadaceae TaxID=72275 RepID=UPI003CFBD5B0
MYENHLIIGATGKTGSRVASRLQKLGYKLKLAARKAEVYFDWSHSSTWAPAMNGIDAIYATYFPDLAMPQAKGDILALCQIAKQNGVRHITLLSGRGEKAAQECEQILQDSGLSWTIVRASWFNQNFSEGLFTQFILDRKLSLPVGHVKEPFIDVDDIADVVVASLTQEGHSGQLYEVTGPELLNFQQLADLFSKQLGERVEFEQISMQQFQQNLQALGVDGDTIGMLTYLFNEVLDGRNEYRCAGVHQALGRPANSFKQFIAGNLECFMPADVSA